jgi:hypothetical protein
VRLTRRGRIAKRLAVFAIMGLVNLTALIIPAYAIAAYAR